MNQLYSSSDTVYSMVRISFFYANVIPVSANKKIRLKVWKETKLGGEQVPNSVELLNITKYP